MEQKINDLAIDLFKEMFNGYICTKSNVRVMGLNETATREWFQQCKKMAKVILEETKKPKK